MTNFAENLKKARLEKGWNQEQLAQAMEISQSAISQFEKGLRLPTPANVKKFSDILGVSRDFLIGEEDMANERVKLMRSIHGLSPGGLKKVEEFIEMVKKFEEPPKKEDH